MIELLEFATRFELTDEVALQKRGNNRWAVNVFGGSVLDKDMNRHYEPMPSSRTEEFISATRFSLEDAYTLARKYIERESNGNV